VRIKTWTYVDIRETGWNRHFGAGSIQEKRGGSREPRRKGDDISNVGYDSKRNNMQVGTT
jgi:hypothetical protein